MKLKNVINKEYINNSTINDDSGPLQYSLPKTNPATANAKYILYQIKL